MLLELNIKDFAVISELHLELREGFNVLTGETGAGKSILVGALSLILGARSSTDMIRTGCKKAEISACFKMPENDELEAIFQSQGLKKPKDGILRIRREINSSGRSRSFIQDNQEPLNSLNALGRRLVDIHGQHEHQSLLNTERHLFILDSFGGLEKQRKKVEELYDLQEKLTKETARLKRLKAKQKEREALLEYQKAEIDKAQLKENEIVALDKELAVLRNAESLKQTSSDIYTALYESEGSLYDALSAKLRSLATITEIDDSLQPVDEILNSVLVQIQEASDMLRSYSDGIDLDQERLELSEERLTLLEGLERKYQMSIDEIIDYRRKIEKETEDYSTLEEAIEEKDAELLQTEEKLRQNALKLSQNRKIIAESLQKEIDEELKELGMKDGRFRVQFKENEDKDDEITVGREGIDNIEFMFSANIGENIRPLAKAASGGELSRIMLAIKNRLTSADFIPTLIFDEVDAGIGGRTAEIVGKKLKKLAAEHQVMVVTHLPQIAALADAHFSVSKFEKSGRVQTRVDLLDWPGRETELARMIGGESFSEAARKTAAEIVKLKRNEK